MLIRLGLSIALSSLIGLERESVKRPAGFRTHVLVCVGSTLVMLVSIFIFHEYKDLTTLQPDRLGAQVISGIGFLGAGTIIREGSSVKGLTTAAGLWAVACIGLAVGSGFYLGAILTTILVLITLALFSKVEKHIKTKGNYHNIKVTSANRPGQLGRIGASLGEMAVSITNINLEEEDDGELIIVYIVVRAPNNVTKFDILNNLRNVEGILEVSHKE
ncbi:MgtC/SapB family protein [Sporosalibacterium faouarense]|uniref:MgtC/SapB family protein n=1 Tax=Sporosalibacterium faouarense TaxID=516123 RepID=UPI00311CC5C7